MFEVMNFEADNIVIKKVKVMDSINNIKRKRYYYE